MDQIDELLNLLNTRILSIFDNVVTIDKETLTNVLTFLQDSQEKIEFLHLDRKSNKMKYDKRINIVN
jgi:hypothetical protein